AAPELPDVAALVKDAVAAIELPAAPELPDVAAMVKDAVAAIELPAAPELPDVCGIVAEALTDAMGAIELPKAPELPDISALITEAVAAVKLPEPEAVDLDAVAAKAAAMITPPAAPELPDVAALVKAAVAEIPKPEDGKPGDNGKDAADLEILPEIDNAKSYPRGTWAAHEGGLWRTYEKSHGMRGWECVVNGQSNTAIKCSDDMRTVTIAVTHSDGRISEKHFDIPAIIYRELYKAGNVYCPGDAVTWGGSLWICTEKTADRPGDLHAQGWRLAVKKGRDGK
ncbi:phage gp6-like head-tail connector protein, partial [Enterobacter huaxiensis]